MEELSQEQRYAYDRFVRGNNLFISGPGGSGKSHLVKYLVNHLYDQGKIHQVTSTTGCSSILLSNSIRMGGRPITVKTIHSWSGIRLGKGPKADIVKGVLKNRRITKEWRRIKTLIIDEVSMLSYKLFDTLHTLAQTIRNNTLPFGGIQLVCIGDFYQLPPIGDYGDPESAAFCFQAPCWREVFTLDNHIELTTIFRQRDPLYRKILNEVRTGTLTEESTQALQQRVGVPYDPQNHGGLMNPMKIFPTKNQVNLVNNHQYDKIPNPEYIYKVTVRTNMKRYIETGELIDEEVLEKCQQMTPMEIDYECRAMTTNMTPETEIRLKRGVPVMCLVNLDVESGLANGSMGVVEDFVHIDGTSSFDDDTMIPLVRFANGLVKPLGKYPWQSSEYPTVCVAQVPLCLAYANSIHKMQGTTMDVCEMNLGGSVFAEHQTYVALSRVRSLEGVYLSAFHPQRIRVNPQVVQFYRQFRPAEPPTPEPTPEPSSPTPTSEPTSEPGDHTCPICIDTLDKPHITECQHTYCLECITRLITSTHTKMVACPLCRQVVSLRTIKSVEPTPKKRTFRPNFTTTTSRPTPLASIFVVKKT
jgi:ATP-dependent DNA helicase PIF1